MAFVPGTTAPPVSVEEHVARVLGTVEPLPPYDQPLMEALGLPTVEEFRSPMDLPSFDNSGMDGYAVLRADLEGASEESPVHLPVVGEAAAGNTRLFAMSAGTTVKIMTGAPVPEGADAIVPVEWTDAGAATVRITRAPEAGQHIRGRGEDVRSGDLLLEEGAILNPRRLGLLASVGRSQVRTRPRPRVVVMSTGSELREPGSKLARDAIYDANSFLLAAAVRRTGAIAYRVGIVSDDPAEFSEALSDQLVRADLVITSGGVSKGEYDVVKEVLGGLDTMWFGEVRLQPGKPQGFGRVGEDGTPIFTLPGNPVSSFVSFELFVLPALRRLMGLTPEQRPRTRVRVATSFRSAPGKQQLVRAAYDFDGEGPCVTPVGGHGSHLLGDLAASNALIVVPARTSWTWRRAPRSRSCCWTGSSDGRGSTADRTHVDEAGAARMVDVSEKSVTTRVATASGRVLVSDTVVGLLRGEGVPKGDALGVARVAGIMAAKRTPDLVPLCHPLAISGVTVDLEVADDAVVITATVRTADRTGVEMEALTAVSVAALTVVDMVKAVDKTAVITGIRVESKSGGRAGTGRARSDPA